MENLRGDLRKFEEMLEEIIWNKVSLEGSPTINVTLLAPILIILPPASNSVNFTTLVKFGLIDVERSQCVKSYKE